SSGSRRFDPLQAAAEVLRDSQEEQAPTKRSASSGGDPVDPLRTAAETVGDAEGGAPAPAETGRLVDDAEGGRPGRDLSPRERRAAAKAARVEAARRRRDERADARSRGRRHQDEVVEIADEPPTERSLIEKLAEARRSATES